MLGKLTPEPWRAASPPFSFLLFSCVLPLLPFLPKSCFFCLPGGASDLSTYLRVDETVFSVIAIFSPVHSLLLFHFYLFPFLPKPVGQGESFLLLFYRKMGSLGVGTPLALREALGWGEGGRVWGGQGIPACVGDCQAVVFSLGRTTGRKGQYRIELVHFRLSFHPP